MVRTTFSENVAICHSWFLIYHAASGSWILRHAVSACFQCDKINLWVVLNADNSPLTCWTSSVAQRNSNMLSEWSMGLCVFFEVPLILKHFHYCKNQSQFVYRESTVAKTPIMPMQSMASQGNTQTNCLWPLSQPSFFKGCVKQISFMKLCLFIALGGDWMQNEQLIDWLNHIEICSHKVLSDKVWGIGIKGQEQWTVDCIIFRKKLSWPFCPFFWLLITYLNSQNSVQPNTGPKIGAILQTINIS